LLGQNVGSTTVGTINTVRIRIASLWLLQNSVSTQGAAAESIVGRNTATSASAAVGLAMGILGASITDLTSIKETVSTTRTRATNWDMKLNTFSAVCRARGFGSVLELKLTTIAGLASINNTITTGSTGALTVRDESMSARATVGSTNVGIESCIANLTNFEYLITTSGTTARVISSRKPTSFAGFAIGVTI